METQSVPEAAGMKHGGGSTSGDFGFFALMAAVLVAVIWVGVLSFEEGMNTEKSKRNGEAWVAWLTDNGAKRFEAGYALSACAGGAAPAVAAATEPLEPSEQAPAAEGEPAAKAAPAAPVPNTWGACLEHIVKATELQHLVNPFTGKPPELVEKCDPADHNLHGDISIEKSVSNPAGSAVPVTISPLVAADAIDSKLQLKLSICDKGAYPIKVAEFEF